MRVTTDFWVSAMVRRVFSSGGFAAVIKHGAPEAGAVFIVARNRLGDLSLFGPAPQADYDTARRQDRLFGALLSEADQAAVDARLDREKRFDPDIWVVEIETGTVPIPDLFAVTTP